MCMYQCMQREQVEVREGGLLAVAEAVRGKELLLWAAAILLTGAGRVLGDVHWVPTMFCLDWICTL